MESKRIEDIGRAMAALDMWDMAGRDCWALLPQMSETAQIVMIAKVNAKLYPDVLVHVLIFPGADEYRDFQMHLISRDYKLAGSPLEFNHFRMELRRDGGIGCEMIRPGFVPRPLTDEEREFYAMLLNECLGVMIRMEDEPNLVRKYFADHALFARKEVVGGTWVDGPMRTLPDQNITYTEQVKMNRAQCDAASKLPVDSAAVWEVDFRLMPMFFTKGRNPRFLYLLAGVNKTNGQRVLWAKMHVDGKPDGVKRLWEGNAQRVLDAITANGKLPAELHFNSPRVLRLLRPLAMNLPFKMVMHSELPTLEAEIARVCETGVI